MECTEGLYASRARVVLRWGGLGGVRVRVALVVVGKASGASETEVDEVV